MSIAMPLKTRDVTSKLISKFEFSEAATRSDDHRWYELKLPGLPVIATKVSHGKNEISDTLLGKIARQLRVRRSFFSQMVECTKSRKEYIEQIVNDPYPPWDTRF